MLLLGIIDIPVWLVFTAIAVVALLWRHTRDFNFFKKQGVPGRTPYPIIGTVRLWGEAVKNHPYDALYQKKKYGDIIAGFMGTSPGLLVFDEEFLSEVLVKDFQNFPDRVTFTGGDKIAEAMVSNVAGKDWKKLRTLMSPAFSTGKLKRMTPEIIRCASQMAQGLLDKDGQEVEVKESAGSYAMDVIACTAFGLRLDSQKDKNDPFVQHAKRAFNFSFFNPFFLASMFLPFLMPVLKFFDMNSFTPKDVQTFFRSVVEQAVAARKDNSDQGKSDFLQLMINAQRGMDIRDPGEDVTDQDAGSDDKHDNKGLTDTEILANGLMFFLAGYDTTASTVAFLLYNLALNQQCQEQVLQEIDSVVGEKEELTYEMLSRMPYLEQCLYESLRLYPITIITMRQAAHDVTIKGIHIRKGMRIVIPVVALHHDETRWPEPMKFIPERFTPENKAKRSPFSWIPFGYGPRNCLAMRLALLEVKVAVVQVLRKVRITTCPKTEIPMSFLLSGLLKPKNGIWLKPEKRTIET